MCCSCLGDDLTIRVSEVAGNSESINLTGKQINVIRRFLPLFSLGIESGRASEMGGKRSKLYAIPDPLNFTVSPFRFGFGMKGNVCAFSTRC